jgi:hypothetical protein
MANTRECPICAAGEMVRREGRLDQCGDTYLPTTVSTCTLCGYAKFEPALGVRWKADTDAPVMQIVPRRAA